MFTIPCSRFFNSEAEIREKIKNIISLREKNGWIDVCSMVENLSTTLPTGEKDQIIGWMTKDIQNKIAIDYDSVSFFWTVYLDDPVQIMICKQDEEKFDPVQNPSHYTEGRKYEPRKVIRDWGLNFNLGNAVKYISRAGRKNSTVEDLEKAKQYIDFELEALKED